MHPSSRTGDEPVSVCINLLLLPPTFGGIGNVAYHQLRRLVGALPAWKFTLLINAETAPHFGDIPGLEIRSVGIRSRWGRLAWLHLVFPWLAGRYSLIHSMGNMGLVLTGVPQVITIHDAYERVSPDRFGWTKRLLMRLLVSASGRKARSIVAVSRNTASDVARFYPHLARKTTVVYSGNKFPVRTDARAEGREGFLFVGTLEPGKNLPLVLRAFARFRALRAGSLRIVGARGWKQSGIPSLIGELGIGNDVEFLGFVSDERLAEAYARSLALVQASSYEGFGLPVIEAMACGCPVIAARNSGLTESGGSAALFFASGDAQELCERMIAVHDRPEVREDCIRKGLAHAARFTWEESARGIAAVYASALRQESGQAGPQVEF